MREVCGSAGSGGSCVARRPRGRTRGAVDRCGIMIIFISSSSIWIILLRLLLRPSPGKAANPVACFLLVGAAGAWGDRRPPHAMVTEMAPNDDAVMLMLVRGRRHAGVGVRDAPPCPPPASPRPDMARPHHHHRSSAHRDLAARVRAVVLFHRALAARVAARTTRAVVMMVN